MRKTYVLEDLLKNMVELENAGYENYTAMAKLCKEYESKELFDYLASQEKHHKKVFEALLRDFDYSLIILEDDYADYLRVFLHNNFKMFRYRHIPETLEEGLRASIHMEKDMLILFHELKKVLGASQLELFENLLSEERKHIKILYEYDEKIKSL
jgi:rubrerythrin